MNSKTSTTQNHENMKVRSDKWQKTNLRHPYKWINKKSPERTKIMHDILSLTFHVPHTVHLIFNIFNNKTQRVKYNKTQINHNIHFMWSANSLTRNTSNASAWRHPVRSYIVANVCTHNPDNMNNYEPVTEEAYYCVLLLQQYALKLVNLRNLQF